MTQRPTREYAPPRFLIASLPARGHMNPALRLANRLALIGCEVTLLATTFSLRQLVAESPKTGVTLTPFSDGYDDGFGSFRRKSFDFDQYRVEFRRLGSIAAREIVQSGLENGLPFCCLVFTLTISWLADLAAEFDTPSALLFVQSATVFNVNYHYFHGHGETVKEFCRSNKEDSSLKLPGLDHLEFAVHDLPTILKNADSEPGFVQLFREHFEALDRECQARVLVNTFESLEPEAMGAMAALGGPRLMAIGPLVRSGEGDKCVEWLDSKPKGSVVFLSFGSIEVLQRPQREEIAKALLGLGRTFLWVVRSENEEEEEEKKLSCEEELDELGMRVSWCSQVAVLSHEAVACFVSHCGWNSTLESLAYGVPVVGFPQRVDQTTNAKLIEEVWRTGLRVRPTCCENGSIVLGEEIKRCLEMVIDGHEFSMNAKKWRDLSREANLEGGSSDQSLKAFVAELTGKDS